VYLNESGRILIGTILPKIGNFFQIGLKKQSVLNVLFSVRFRGIAQIIPYGILGYGYQTLFDQNSFLTPQNVKSIDFVPKSLRAS